MYFREFLNLFRAGRKGQGKESKARRKKFRQPKRGRGGRGACPPKFCFAKLWRVKGEFRRTRAEVRQQADKLRSRRPARSEQNPAKKFPFPFTCPPKRGTKPRARRLIQYGGDGGS